MKASVVLRVKKLKGADIVLRAARHNKRTIQAELGAYGHIDVSRTHLNQTLWGPKEPEEIAKRADKLMSEAGITKPRKDCVRALEIVLSLPVENDVDKESYFYDAAKWFGRRFGGEQNILSADIHYDEEVPHCHVIILPLIDGRMIGSSAIGYKGKLNRLKDDFHKEIGSLYGLDRPATPLHGTAKVKAGEAVIAEIRRLDDPVLKSRFWHPVEKAIRANPAAFLENLGVEGQRVRDRRSMASIMTSTGKGAGMLEAEAIINRQSIKSEAYAL